MGILSLAGKQCIITGATGNIGFAIAQTFASAGAAVTLVGRNESRLADKLRELATQSPNIEHGGHRAVQEGILTSADWRRIISSGPPPDVLVNCAGVSQNLRILRVSETDADEILDVNLKSAILAWLLGLTSALAVELAESGIRVNAIVPGYIETNMTKGLQTKFAQTIPLKRFGTAEEVADAAAFLVRNEYANNCILTLDGGLSAV
ncbi:hypothetical protein P8C59_006381 [Phyllachora maydis]|uniref:Uncharacterized protein n=1 Tax=Phyllachora maydis TaxID=1825666 RepID=A0AAD9MD66_9PEZI|nr:hypothetical protein P8C59_006381 [Phyllachora maydis]